PQKLRQIFDSRRDFRKDQSGLAECVPDLYLSCTTGAGSQTRPVAGISMSSCRLQAPGDRPAAADPEHPRTPTAVQTCLRRPWVGGHLGLLYPEMPQAAMVWWPPRPPLP